MTQWLALFVWTLVLELPVYEWSLGHSARAWWEPAIVTLALNLLTHPAFTWWQLAFAPAALWVAAAEFGIVGVEGLALAFLWRRRISIQAALGTALAANGLSYGAGSLAWCILGS